MSTSLYDLIGTVKDLTIPCLSVVKGLTDAPVAESNNKL